MVETATYVSELEAKHLESYRSLVAAYLGGLSKDDLPVTDALKLEMRGVVEAIEVAALWLPDSEELSMKLALAGRCGDCAGQFQILGERLASSGVSPTSFDPRHGGYSKLFAFFRSLQTTEERAAAGFLTLGGLNLVRFEALAAWCESKGDSETAAVYRGRLTDDEQRHVQHGRQMLIEVANTEESQARARRSTYRTIEIVGEIQELGLLRKFLLRSIRK